MMQVIMDSPPRLNLGHGQNHRAVAGGCKRSAPVAIRARWLRTHPLTAGGSDFSRKAVYNPPHMGLFWRRKKDEFVSLRLNEPAEAAPQTPAPPVEPPRVETVKKEEPPQQTVKPEPVAP